MADTLTSGNQAAETRNPSWFKPGNNVNPHGRPKGSTNKLSVKGLLSELSNTVGKPYEQQLAENYKTALLSEDRKTILAYDNLFLSKLLADKVSVEVSEGQEALDNKRAAFTQALHAFGMAVTVADGSQTVPLPTIDGAITVEPTVSDGDRPQDGDMPWIS